MTTQDETRKVARPALAMLTEKDLAYAALEAAKQAQDASAIESARLWVARLQVEERQARLLLLAHVSARMLKDMQEKGTRQTWLVRGSGS